MKRIQKILGPYLSQTMNSVSAMQQNFPRSANGSFPFPVNVLERSMVPEEKEERPAQPQESKETPKMMFDLKGSIYKRYTQLADNKKFWNGS